MELYIFRHGRTVWNAQRKIQGDTDIALAKEGIDMAKAVAEKLQIFILTRFIPARCSAPMRRPAF